MEDTLNLWRSLVPVSETFSGREICEPVFQPCYREEDGTAYEGVWKVTAGETRYILKRAKASEGEIYRTFFTPPRPYAPAVIARADTAEGEYLLLEFIDGTDLLRPTKPRLLSAVRAISAMQNDFWQDDALAGRGYTFLQSFSDRKARRAYLGSALLEKWYDVYLEAYERLPRTLCHDDLLPFNLLIDGARAVLIDWEAGGILPYPVCIARLTAHGRSHGAFFRMTPEQRRYAAEAYYALALRPHGIGHDAFVRALSLFLFSESCEWVVIGNRYGKEECSYYLPYLRTANRMARALERGEPLF